ncbi:EMC3/TMCO1 family protein [Candidatus Aenigmatarchaeota archaeon]
MVFETLIAIPVLAVTLYAIVILIIINFFYKILINQEEAKALKEKTKLIRSRMKEYQKSGNKEKTSELMSEMMQDQNKLMRMTMKPMIVSFIIVIVLLPGINNMYGDLLVPMENGFADFQLNEKDYSLQFSENNIDVISNGEDVFSCEVPCTQKINDLNYIVKLRDDSMVFAPIAAKLPVPIKFFILGQDAVIDGEDEVVIGWLAWYIILSIPIAIIIRRTFKIHM